MMIHIALSLFLFTMMLGFYYLYKSIKLRKKRSKIYEIYKVKDTGERRSVLMRFGDKFDNSSVAKDLSLKLQQADLKIKPSEFMMLFLLIFIVMWVINNKLLSLMFPLGLLLAFAIVFFGTRFLLSSRKNKRREKLDAQLPEICRLMANSLKAGLTIQQGIGNCADDLSEPAKTDFKQMEKEMAIGEDLENVLNKFRDKAASSDVNIFTGTLLIQKQVGGNLGKILDMMAQTLESRSRVFKEIRSATAEGKAVAYMLPLMPVAMCALMSLVIPGFLNPLFTVFGMILLGIVGAIIFIGILLIRRLTDIKV
ncbi:type II secretion system F family protein [Virgibacillus doumboii]|uniref:type II secretion system F family protein n=1 Tax=Virgibacillus doumboii TaxID=2697503 RepID=UPI0013DEF836|nr:type II secretion system F family protein [Virgibacillus doumboii]